MPKRILSVTLLVLALFARVALAETDVRAQTATPARTIKFGSFTPPPSPTPTKTPIPTKTPVPTNPEAVPTDSNVETSPTPGEEEENTGNASEITDLVAQIRKNCFGGVVAVSNVNCVDKLILPPGVSAQTISELKISTLYAGEGFLQCVGFVRASVMRKYGTTLTNGGHAIDYATKIPGGYRFIHAATGANMKINDLAIWNYDTVGHIAYVTGVFKNGVFQVAEANFQSKGEVQTSYKTTDSPNFVGFLRRE